MHQAALSNITSRHASILPVISDGMEPALRRGDVAVIEPTMRYEGEGIYACFGRIGDTIELWRVTTDLSHRKGCGPWVSLSLDNARYAGRFELPLQKFEEIVLGRVCGRLEMGL